MSESAEWLDTQTKACLQKDPPDKQAPADVDGFTLVLLERGADCQRVERAIRALAGDDVPVEVNCPAVLRQNLLLPDALVGQFELICSDSISVFLRDDVVRYAEPSYLCSLYDHLRTAEEFSPVTVQLESIPDNENGRRFLLQFFGQFLGVGATHTVARKKARIMAHWGTKMGISVAVDDRAA
jgi:hypothetical protein